MHRANLLGINKKLMRVALIVLASESHGSFLQQISIFIYSFLYCYVFAVKSGVVS